MCCFWKSEGKSMMTKKCVSNLVLFHGTFLWFSTDHQRAIIVQSCILLNVRWYGNRVEQMLYKGTQHAMKNTSLQKEHKWDMTNESLEHFYSCLPETYIHHKQQHLYDTNEYIHDNWMNIHRIEECVYSKTWKWQNTHHHTNWTCWNIDKTDHYQSSREESSRTGNTMHSTRSYLSSCD